MLSSKNSFKLLCIMFNHVKFTIRCDKLFLHALKSWHKLHGTKNKNKKK